MFGLLRHIRDKSESDGDLVSRQISQDLNQIAEIDRQRNQVTNRRTAARIERDLNLTTDSDEDRYGLIQSLIEKDQMEKLGNEKRKDKEDELNAQKLAKIEKQKKSKNIVTKNQVEKYFEPKRIYSDDEMEIEHRREQKNKIIAAEDLRPVYPFSLHKNDKNFRIGIESELLKNKNKKNQIENEFEQLVNQNKTIEILPPIQSSSKIETKNKQFNKNFGTISPSRLKMAVFKQRLRTDKALYQHFSKKIISQRKKLVNDLEEKRQNEIKKTLLKYYKNKEDLLAQLDTSSLSSLLQVYNQSNPEDNDVGNKNGTNKIGMPSSQDDPHIDPHSDPQSTQNQGTQSDDIYNVVTRVEMDSIITHDELKVQELCHYCTYRPLHLYNTTSSNSDNNEPLPFTTENGQSHWSIIPPKFAAELLKGGQFVQDVELCLFALQHGLPIVPANSQYVGMVNQAYASGEINAESGTNETDLNVSIPRVKALNSVIEIQDYISFAYKHRLSSHSPYQLPLGATKNNDKNTQNEQQIVVKLQTDWFGITQRDPIELFSEQPEHANKNAFVSTHNGVTFFCKDFYAMQIVLALASFHSCYCAVHEIEKKVGGTKCGDYGEESDVFIYQIPVYFNTGCCLCHKDGEIEFIHNTPSTHNLSMRQSEDDEKIEDEKSDEKSDGKISKKEKMKKKKKKLQQIGFDFNHEQLQQGECFIGDLVDSFGIKIEQYTYCVPHLKSVSDIQAMIDQNEKSE
jgi:hypothetical protein